MMQLNQISGVVIGSGVSNDRRIKLESLALGRADCGLVRRWFAVRVASGREKAVEKALDGYGIEALVPLRRIPERRRGRCVFPERWVPVIHGYVLVCLPVNGVILAGLLGVDGVSGVIGGYDNPKPILAKEVNVFKELAVCGAYDLDAPVDIILQVGERCRVVNGPFSGFAAEVISGGTRGRGDVVVSVEILGAQVPVTMPLAMLGKL
ncbi:MULTISPECIES: transcription termination/antitermination protein NusG [Rhizobium/Agrobacterium group]|uniref:transcription termination/antitermination protein NusG n=1 Tax=Rhizobium/Agrobacterium group TaxID=227290 RepID=UPI000674BB4B|nr:MULTISPECIES: transcription termination/antitermination NusG family protein [Rhizobium/Agrobacterium group]